jgi:glycosyltransferase involved in cell wall biosynthesis
MDGTGAEAKGGAMPNTMPAARRTGVDVEIVVPVYNEEATLACSVQRVHDYLEGQFPFSWLITVADNASTDGTWEIACGLAERLKGVATLHVDQKGRGGALRAAWMASQACVVAYMDVDLSTDLNALLPLVAPVLSGHSDVAIGSRLTSGSHVVRGPKREFISRLYNLVLRATLRSSFSDAQCGFKAMRASTARELVPLVEDNNWFFDTELLVLAERHGLRVHEVAVDWVDDPDSRVDIVRTAKDDLKGIARLMFHLNAPARVADDDDAARPQGFHGRHHRRPSPRRTGRPAGTAGPRGPDVPAAANRA